MTIKYQFIWSTDQVCSGQMVNSHGLQIMLFCVCIWLNTVCLCMLCVHRTVQYVKRQKKCWRKQSAMMCGWQGLGMGGHLGPADCAGKGGGCTVGGAERCQCQEERVNTPLKCQSHPGSKQPIIAQSYTIDLLISASSLSLTISALQFFTPVSLLCALQLRLTPFCPPSTNSYGSLSLTLSYLFSCCD